MHRTVVKAKGVREIPTPLNFKNIKIEVGDGQTKEAGIFSASYITYKVRTEPLGYEVRRRDTEFIFLRKILARLYPHILVPACLGGAPNKAIPKVIEKRERYYTRFLSAIMRSEELKSSQFLLSFVHETDPKVFSKIMKDAEKSKAPRGLEEFTLAEGEAKCHPSTASTQFCLKMPDYVETYRLLYQEMMDCAEEVHERSGELANSMLRLHRNLEQLSELNRMIKCQPQHELFAWLSKLATGTGNFVYQTGQLVQDFLGEDYMRPHLEEPESFKELMQMREAAHNLFVKVEKTLIEKKEKLFKAGDPNKWGSGPFSCFTHERQINELKDRLQQDKAFAFTYMLPKETQEYEQKKEELFFLTN